MNKPTPPAASKPSPAGRPSPVAGKPFKMSDEITIIPQGRNTQKTPTTSSVSYIYSILTYSIHIRYIFFNFQYHFLSIIEFPSIFHVKIKVFRKKI